MKKPPIKAPVTNEKGMVTSVWEPFFILLAQDNMKPESTTNTLAKKNTIFYSTTDSKLSFKDSSGTVHNLY
jgi:phosphoribosyl-AMP cyclohydrolase